MTNNRKQLEAVRELRVELAKLQKLVATVENRGEPVFYAARMEIKDMKRQIAPTRKPTADLGMRGKSRGEAGCEMKA